MQLRAVLADLAAAKAKETRKTLARPNEHHKKLDDIRLFLFAHTTVFSLTRARLVGWCACSRFVLPIFSWGERLANVGNVHPKHRNALGKGSSSSRHKPHPTYVYTHKQRTFPPARSGPIPDVPLPSFRSWGFVLRVSSHYHHHRRRRRRPTERPPPPSTVSVYRRGVCVRTRSENEN